MQSLALLGAVHNPCQRREMALSANNGLVNGPEHNQLVQFFTLDSSKIEVFERCFFDIVTTQNDHPRYVKHILGRIYMFFTRGTWPPWLHDTARAIPGLGPPDRWPSCLRKAGLFPLRLAQGVDRDLLDEFLYRLYCMHLAVLAARMAAGAWD